MKKPDAAYLASSPRVFSPQTPESRMVVMDANQHVTIVHQRRLRPRRRRRPRRLGAPPLW